MSEHNLPLPSGRTMLGSIDAVPAALAASFDAFEFIRATAEGFGSQTTETFATWAMTGAEAADGRDAIVFAPSLPPGDITNRSVNAAGEDETADALAELATRLAAQLATVASRADDPADKAACQRAAGHATRISQLLDRNH